MSPSLKAWWQKWWFGFALTGLLIAFELALVAIALFSTPQGYRWLGNISPRDADAPVYISYLGQSGSSWLLRNLYSDLPQTPRFDLFWSAGGILVKAGINPFFTYEILRWLCTAALAFALYAAAKRITQNERQARLGSLIIANGMGAGWIYAFVNHIATRRVLTPLPPDLTSFFSVPTTLLGGAHLILALALQLLLARLIWRNLTQRDDENMWQVCLMTFLLAAIQPYYIPLIGLISVISLAIGLRNRVPKRIIWRFLAINVSLLPAVAYFAWISRQDMIFGQRFLSNNAIPLEPVLFWVMSLTFIIIASVWLALKKIPTEYRPQNSLAWIWIWIMAAILCLLLPFPWKGKYTQGLLPALAMLTLPFWLCLIDKLMTRKRSLWRSSLVGLFLAAPFLYLALSQYLITQTPGINHLFYEPSEVFSGWRWLRSQPADGVSLADDMNVALWTPAYTLKPVWLGHKRETPDADRRYARLMSWETDRDQGRFNAFLDQNRIDRLFATDKDAQSLYAENLDSNLWTVAFTQNNATLWQRKTP